MHICGLFLRRVEFSWPLWLGYVNSRASRLASTLSWARPPSSIRSPIPCRAMSSRPCRDSIATAHLSTFAQAWLERHRFLNHALHELPADGLLAARHSRRPLRVQ